MPGPRGGIPVRPLPVFGRGIVQATLPTPIELKQVLVRKELKKFDTLIEKLDKLETDSVFVEKFESMEKADRVKCD